MLTEKFELPHYYKPERFMKPKPRLEKKKRKCMMCQKEFMSDWIGDRICKPCQLTDLWKSGPNCYVQSLNLSDLGSQTPRNLPSSFKNKKKEQEQFHDEKYLLDEEFDD